MQELRLSSNDLTQLPAGFGKLAALEELQVDGNQLAQLPAGFGSLGRLQELSREGRGRGVWISVGHPGIESAPGIP